MRLFARADGYGATQIVFLHGFASCHGLWRPITDALSPERRTIAYDLPGHESSLGWPDAGPAPAKIAVRAISADLDARGIRNSILSAIPSAERSRRCWHRRGDRAHWRGVADSIGRRALRHGAGLISAPRPAG